MTLTQLAYVVAVAQHKNFGAAAAASFVTQPTLSMQIQKLEDELGVVIFDRSRQPIRLTPIGQKVVEQARITLGEARKLRDLTAEEKNDVTGAIGVGVIPTLSPYVLPLFIQKFSEHYPGAQITVEELQTQTIVDRIRSDSLDVGILVTPLHVSSIEEHVLFYEPFQLYVSPGHALASAKQVSEKDLSLDDVWLLSEGHCFRDQVINLCGDPKSKSRTHGNLRFESGNLETLKKMVDQSDGYTLLPWLAAREIPEGAKRKQLKEFRAPVPTREVSLVHSHLYKKRAVVDALLEQIQSAIPKELIRPKGAKFHRVDMPVVS